MSLQQLQTLIDAFKSEPLDLSASIEQMRAAVDQMTSRSPVDADVKCEPVRADGVASEWVSVPGADAGRPILYLHGGGYVVGSVKGYRSMAGRLSRAAKARVLNDSSRLADRATQAGVDVTYEPWDHMIHVWHLFAPMLDEGQQAIDRIGEFVRKHTS